MNNVRYRVTGTHEKKGFRSTVEFTLFAANVLKEILESLGYKNVQITEERFTG